MEHQQGPQPILPIELVEKIILQLGPVLPTPAQRHAKVYTPSRLASRALRTTVDTQHPALANIMVRYLLFELGLQCEEAPFLSDPHKLTRTEPLVEPPPPELPSLALSWLANVTELAGEEWCSSPSHSELTLFSNIINVAAGNLRKITIHDARLEFLPPALARCTQLASFSLTHSSFLPSFGSPTDSKYSERCMEELVGILLGMPRLENLVIKECYPQVFALHVKEFQHLRCIDVHDEEVCILDCIDLATHPTIEELNLDWGRLGKRHLICANGADEGCCADDEEEYENWETCLGHLVCDNNILRRLDLSGAQDISREDAKRFEEEFWGKQERDWLKIEQDGWEPVYSDGW